MNYTLQTTLVEVLIPYLIDEDDILGFISYNIDSDDVPGYANGYKDFGHIAEIYIDKIYRNKGYAKKLVQSVELIFEKSKINDIYLVDINQNENLWKSLNYINTGIIEPEENGIIFTKKLKISKQIFTKYYIYKVM